jgi:hypothetical protein
MSQDNACTHSAAHTVESCQQQSFKVLKHPLYGHDLAPSDCHLFGPFKEALRGGHFASDRVKEAVREWFVTQAKTFFRANGSLRTSVDQVC